MAAPGSSRLTGFSLMNRTLAGTARGGGGRGRAADDAIMINTYGEGRFVWDCTGGGGGVQGRAADDAIMINTYGGRGGGGVLLAAPTFIFVVSSPCPKPFQQTGSNSWWTVTWAWPGFRSSTALRWHSSWR